jgi:IclR family acetate operon transcriptional repressor
MIRVIANTSAAKGVVELIWVDRTVTVLTTLARSPQGAGISELSRLHGVPKSTLHRMLNALKTHGFVAQDPSTRRYLLGPELIHLGQRTARRRSSKRDLASAASREQMAG